MKALSIAAMLTLGALATTTGCAHHARSQFPTTSALSLDRVVLYRNGVGYFERRGQVEGDTLRLKVRKDQVNDLLKSLTIVDRKTGRALSVSMPLDPTTWASAALSTLAPGRGSLARVLDKLRGVAVALATTRGTLEGRIVMVERISNEPDPTPQRGGRTLISTQRHSRDHKITLMNGQRLQVVRLSKVRGVTIKDGDLAMQFHRRLDATAGEGMFQQVEVAIRLDGSGEHDLVVSYVVEAPMWKPTYRVVLPKDGKGEALLQAWAVVDNTSGEDWRNVQLSLTAGAPIAFRYDLHSPRKVWRDDLSHKGTHRRARVAMGEASFESDNDADDSKLADGKKKDELRDQKKRRAKSSSARRRLRSRAGRSADAFGAFKPKSAAKEPPPAPSGGIIDLENLRRSTAARAKASSASGLTRFDLQNRVTVPQGSSTMVAVINQVVKGEETFLYRPGGAGVGYESNPYRVVRFKNSTPFVLEPGPISIYSGGSFVGEGISETVGSKTSATVPFAVESGIMVRRISSSIPENIKLIKIVRGVIWVQRFGQRKTVWEVKSQTMDKGYTVLIRHPRFAARYKLKNRPTGTEDLPNAYLIPVAVPAGKKSGKIEVIEQSPMRTTLSIWDRRAVKLLSTLLLSADLSAVDRAKLEPLVKLRQDIGRIDTKIRGLKREKWQYRQRARDTQDNLYAIERDKSAAAAKLRRDLQKRLDDFSKQADRVGLEMAKLNRERLQLKIKLEDGLQKLTIKGSK